MLGCDLGETPTHQESLWSGVTLSGVACGSELSGMEQAETTTEAT